MRRFLLLGFVALLTLLPVACNRSTSAVAKATQLQKQGLPDKALPLFQRAFFRSKPSDPAAQARLLVHIGECLESLHRLPDAYASFSKAAEIDPQNASAHLHLGEMYLLAGDNDRANQEAAFLLKQSQTPNADAMALLGAAAEASGHDDIATEAFEKVLRAEPGRVKVAIDLADLYNRSGQTERARTVLDSAAKAQPSSSVPWIALGRLEEQEGNPPAAESAYSNAVRAEDTAETNLHLAQFYERSRKIAEARAALRRADMLRTNAPTAVPDFEFTAGKYRSASDGYLAALQSSAPLSKDPRVRSERRKLISRLVESDLALAQDADPATRKAALASAQHHLSAYSCELEDASRSLLQAELALANDDLLQAAIASTQALSEAPDSPAAHYVAGLIRYRSTDLPGARGEWQQSLDLDETFIPARLALTREQLSEHDFTAALTTIIPVVRREPANISALILFSRALIGTGSYDSARSIAARVRALQPDSPYPHILQGETALAESKYASALIEFQQALLLDTHSKEAIDGLTRVYSVAHITRPMLLKMERVGMAEPRSATLLEIAGRNFISIHLYADAERCLRESISVDSSRHSAAEWLARVQARQGDLAGASRSFAGVREFSPMLAGVEAQQQHNDSAAIGRYEQAIRRGDTTGVAANNLAWLLAEQHQQLDRALGLAERARQLQPDNPAVLDTVGFVYLARREYSDAIRVLEEANRLASRKDYSEPGVSAQIRHHLAEAYYRTGQTDRAELMASLVTR